MGQRILAYVFIALGLLTVTYFRKYTGSVIPHPAIFWVLGLIMTVAGMAFLRFTPAALDRRMQKQIDDTIYHLKVNGERIRVDLSQCEIKERSYTEERQRYGAEDELLTFDFERQIQTLNALGGDNSRNVTQVQVTQTVVIFSRQNPLTGETERFVSRVIPKDKVTVAFYLEEQGETSLYVDKTDRQLYYFDLDFLFSRR
jgi:hypothetical protein